MNLLLHDIELRQLPDNMNDLVEWRKLFRFRYFLCFFIIREDIYFFVKIIHSLPEGTEGMSILTIVMSNMNL